MRRLTATACFTLLGLISFWCWAGIDEALSGRFFQNAIRPGCHEIDKCPVSFFEELLFFLIVLGPAVLFGISAAIFSKTRRTWQSWLQLLGSLMGIHWVLMLIDRLA